MKTIFDAWRIAATAGTTATESARTQAARIARWASQPRPYNWRDLMTKNTVASIGAIAVIAFLAGVAVSLKRNVLASIPFAHNFLTLADNQESAVLAVDGTGLTIRSKNPTAIEPYEKATVEQLAKLHPIYAAWAKEHQDMVGSLLIKVIVDESGDVVRAETIASRPPNGDFTKVILSEIRQWSFPAGDTEQIEITIPIVFVPKGMDSNTIVQWERKTRAGEKEPKLPVAARAIKPAPAAAPGADKRAPTPPAVNGKRDILQQAAPPSTQNRTRAKPLAASVATTQAVGLRDQPRYSAKRVLEVGAETKLNVIENNGDWLKVKVADKGPIGFVRREFIAPLN